MPTISKKNHAFEEYCPQITICIPSYNRGTRLLKNIKKWRRYLNKDYPILILDNNSTLCKRDYKKIEDLAKVTDGLNYIRHQNNLLFEGNFLSMFRVVPSPFFLIVSDEDEPNFEGISQLNKRLPEMQDYGSLRASMAPIEGAIKRQSHIWDTKEYSAGPEAIKWFGLTGNYASGAIYNRKLLVELGFDKRLEDNMNEHRIYPHLYMNILAAGSTKTAFCSEVVCFEGEPTEIGDHETDYFGPYSYGQRLDQFVSLRNAILEPFAMADGDFDSEGFFSCYIHLSHKYLKLVSYVNMVMYEAHLMDQKLITNSFVAFCISCAQGMPGFETHKDSLFRVLTNYGNKYHAVYEKHKITRSQFFVSEKRRLAELSASQ